MILAIDPGDTQSAFVLLSNDTLRPVMHAKEPNETILYERIPEIMGRFRPDVAIEMVACYGMTAGKSLFDTCVWIGRFWEACGTSPHRELIYRIEEKMDLCHNSRAKDANIRQALIDRFAPNTSNGGKGTKKEPGFFYGFSADQWAAMAVGVTYADWRAGRFQRTGRHESCTTSG